MIKRLIFDIDNTLIVGANFKIAQEKMLRKCKIYNKRNSEKLTLAIESYEEHFDNYNKKDFIKYISDMLEIDLPKEFIEEVFKECKKVITKTSKELQKLLQKLSAKYEMVLLSNFFEEVQRKRLEKMGIGHYFTEYYGEKLIKPHKQVYLHACGGNKPEECVMIGDNFKLDIKPARESGIHTIYINPQKAEIEFSDVVSIEKVENITNEIIESFNKQKLFI